MIFFVFPKIIVYFCSMGNSPSFKNNKKAVWHGAYRPRQEEQL